MTIVVRPLVESDLDEADRHHAARLRTFLGLKDPAAMWDDADYTHSRWRSDPEGALAADHAGRLAGSNFAVRWGSLGYFGPLSVRPELWDQKIGQHLVEARWRRSSAGACAIRGLYTLHRAPSTSRFISATDSGRVS